jgi:hypothetical protein
MERSHHDSTNKQVRRHRAITIEVTVDIGGSMLKAEESIQAELNQIGTVATGENAGESKALPRPNGKMIELDAIIAALDLG